jgi:hypothetical protein
LRSIAPGNFFGRSNYMAEPADSGQGPASRVASTKNPPKTQSGGLKVVGNVGEIFPAIPKPLIKQGFSSHGGGEVRLHTWPKKYF